MHDFDELESIKRIIKSRLGDDFSVYVEYRKLLNLLVSVAFSMATDKISKTELAYPLNFFERLKESIFTNWMKKKWPIKMIFHTVEVSALYPDFKFDGRRYMFPVLKPYDYSRAIDSRSQLVQDPIFDTFTLENVDYGISIPLNLKYKSDDITYLYRKLKDSHYDFINHHDEKHIEIKYPINLWEALKEQEWFSRYLKVLFPVKYETHIFDSSKIINDYNSPIDQRYVIKVQYTKYEYTDEG